MKKKCLYILVAFITSSCNWIGTKNGTDQPHVLARVFEEYLYLDEIAGLLDENTSAEDSIEIIRNYVDSWVRTNIVLNYAESNPNMEQEEIERRINDYRKALIGYYYEREIVRQRLDTTVAKEEIAKYYSEYKINFELNEPILRLRYVRVNPASPKLDSLKYWIRSNKEKHLMRLEDYCFQYAINFSLNDTVWYPYRKVTRNIPLFTENPGDYFVSNKFIKYTDSTGLHFTYIMEFRTKGTISPMNYVYEDIKKIIINKRKLKLIDRTYDALYEEGIRKKQIEVFI